MNIKNKEPIQAALDSLEMALENLEDKEEYTLNDVSVKDLWDIWEEASHQLGMANMDVSETSMMKEELKHFADGFHEGEWERDVEVPRPWPGLDQILKDMDIPKEWESVKTLTGDEFTKKYGNIKSEVNQGGGYTTHTPEWIYESPDGKIIYRRREGNDKRQLLYKHPQYGPPYTMTDMSGHDEWIDEDEAKKRHWYNDYVKGKKK
jgi:hypothetical protein